METKTPEQIALEIGAPTANLLGTQDWHPPLQPGVVISMLHYSDATPMVCFRIIQDDIVFSKLTGELQADPAEIDQAFADAVVIEQHKNLEVIPAINATVPDLDPSAPIIRGLNFQGKEMIADLVNGQIVNLREPIPSPQFSLDNGVLKVDVSALPQAAGDAITTAVAAVNAQPVLTSSLLTGA